MKKKKVASLLLAGAMLVSALTGCGAGDGSAASAAASGSATAAETDIKPSGKNIVYGLSATWSSLQFWNGPSTMSCMMEDVLFEPLAKPGPDKLNYRNAESIDVSEDGKVWTCHLDQRVKWSDGEPTTAYDWEWTFQTVTDPTFGIYETSYVTSALVGTDDSGVRVEGEELGMKALDDYTLEITWKNPTPLDGFFNWYGYYYRALPKHLLEDVKPADITSCDYWKNPIGNGPLLYVDEPVTGQEITFKPWSDYYLGCGDYDTVTYKVVSDDSAASAMLNGDLDAYYALQDFDAIKTLEDAESVDVEKAQTGDFFGMSINNEKFNANVRHALSMLIDRETLVAACTGGYGYPITDSATASKGANNDYNVEEAKKILDEEGWDYNYVITIACGARRENQATIIQQNWAAAGVQSEIRTGETASIFSDAMNGNVDCCLWANGLSYSATVDETTLDPSASTYSRVQDSKYYDLCVQIDFETDEAKKQEEIDQLAEAMRTECPYIWIYATPSMIITSKRLSGVQPGTQDQPWMWTLAE